MSNYFYSATRDSFYPVEIQDSYTSAGTWPDDALAVDDSVYQEFVACDAPNGKHRVAGSDGMPEWADIQPPSHDELVSEATSKKMLLLEGAEDTIRLLERAVKLGIATDKEIALLEEWEKYSVLLMRLSPADAPNIDWPEVPEDVA